MESLCGLLLPDNGRILRLPEIKICIFSSKSSRKIWNVRKKSYLCNPKTITGSVRITVSTQDSQSCNRGSIPLPTTKKEFRFLLNSFFVCLPPWEEEFHILVERCIGHLLRDELPLSYDGSSANPCVMICD